MTRRYLELKNNTINHEGRFRRVDLNISLGFVIFDFLYFLHKRELKIASMIFLFWWFIGILLYLTNQFYIINLETKVLILVLIKIIITIFSNKFALFIYLNSGYEPYNAEFIGSDGIVNKLNYTFCKKTKKINIK